MTEKIENILDQIKDLTLLEANELVTKLEEVFNIDVRSGCCRKLCTSRWCCRWF